MKFALIVGALVFACSARVVGATPPSPPTPSSSTPPSPTPSPSPPPSGPEGFRLEPRPSFDDVFGDAESYRKTVDRFTSVADAMQQSRDGFARSVQATLAKLAPPVDGSKRARGCPELDVSPTYARAARLGAEYLRSGRELTSHYEQIRELDRLGETVGLTPDYRLKVKRAMAQYQGLLTDYREMKVAFHDQLADELKFAGCNLDHLLARADAAGVKEESWPAPGQPGAPGVAVATAGGSSATLTSATDGAPIVTPREGTDPPLPSRSGIFIFIDNTRCSTGTHVSLDGKPVSDVPGATRAALQTTPGPHDLCLVPDGSKKKCGEPGTLRKSYLHEGWTISLRCQ